MDVMPLYSAEKEAVRLPAHTVTCKKGSKVIPSSLRHLTPFALAGHKQP